MDQALLIRRQKNTDACRKWRQKNPAAASQIVREYQKRFPDKVAERQKRYQALPETKEKNRTRQTKLRALNPTANAWYNRRKLYGMTYEAFKQLLQEQDYKCSICSVVLVEDKKTHVDHCHDTGKIRALLCASCNCGLGFFRDSPELLQDAYNYLRKHKG